MTNGCYPINVYRYFGEKTENKKQKSAWNICHSCSEYEFETSAQYPVRSTFSLQ